MGHFGSKLGVLARILAPSWGSWGSFWLQVRSLGGFWAILGPTWPQEGPKRENIQKSQTFSAPFWRPKVEPKSIQNRSGGLPKSTVFFIGFGVGCWWHLVPTWLQFGRQNPPQIDPSWLQDPSKVRSRCRPIFCLIFDRPGIVFLSIWLRSRPAEGPKKS